MIGIDWLAGRGYTMIQLWWPAAYDGRRDQVMGRFLAGIWENLADPIITGRGEIGQPKLFAETPYAELADGSSAAMKELDSMRAQSTTSRSSIVDGSIN
jgi:hypothetical protein